MQISLSHRAGSVVLGANTFDQVQEQRCGFFFWETIHVGLRVCIEFLVLRLVIRLVVRVYHTFEDGPLIQAVSFHIFHVVPVAAEMRRLRSMRFEAVLQAFLLVDDDNHTFAVQVVTMKVHGSFNALLPRVYPFVSDAPHGEKIHSILICILSGHPVQRPAGWARGGVYIDNIPKLQRKGKSKADNRYGSVTISAPCTP